MALYCTAKRTEHTNVADMVLICMSVCERNIESFLLEGSIRSKPFSRKIQAIIIRPTLLLIVTIRREPGKPSVAGEACGEILKVKVNQVNQTMLPVQLSSFDISFVWIPGDMVG